MKIMMIEDVKEKMLKIINDIGIYIDRKECDKDIDLAEYITDSLTFIMLLVEIEERFKVEITEDMLLLENIKSFNALAEKIYGLCSE